MATFVPRKPSGLVYDERMEKHFCTTGTHPECPERISCIYEELQKQGLVDACTRVESREATPEELKSVHTWEHIQKMATTKDMNQRKVNAVADEYNSVYLNPSSNEAALFAAGSLLNITEKVVKGELENGVAIIRPPGHHAEAHLAMGFCIYNNVAIAAHRAVNEWGLQRVLIVDWDVHHGNGTQNMFYDDPRVMFFSSHRYHDGTFYPPGRGGDPTMVGKEKGLGYNINVGWNRSLMGDAEYLMMFYDVLLPIAQRFRPQLVLISAGFDAARGDPLGHCRVSPSGYAQMTHALMGLARGKVVMVLEGGYNLASIKASFAACTRVLLGEAPPELEESEFELDRYQSACASVRATVTALQPHWPILNKEPALPDLAALKVKDAESSDSEVDERRASSAARQQQQEQQQQQQQRSTQASAHSSPKKEPGTSPKAAPKSQQTSAQSSPKRSPEKH